MGTSAPPATGYADDQRVENWDSPSLYSDSALNVAGFVETGAMNVSRYAYLAGRDLTQNADLLVTMTWTMFQGGAGVVGVRNFLLSQNILAVAQYRIPNLGPWVNVRWTKVGAGAATHTSQLIGTNRFHPLEFIPQNPVLVDQHIVPVANGADLAMYPVDYYAGPLRVWFNAPAVIQSFLALQALDSGGVWQYIDQHNTSANLNTYDMVAPPGAWRFLVHNGTGANQTYHVTCAPSMTGAI